MTFSIIGVLKLGKTEYLDEFRSDVDLKTQLSELNLVSIRNTLLEV